MCFWLKAIISLLLFCDAVAAQNVFILNPVSGVPLFTENLVSEWRFDDGSGDTLTDYVGSNDGQLGSAAGADANDPDWVAAGLDFPTTGDRVQITGLTFDPSAGAWSLSFVGRYDSVQAVDVTLWSQQNGTGTGRSILIIDTTDDTMGSFLSGTETSATQTISTGYHHFTLTYNGSGTLTYYLDGDAGVTASATPEAANGAHWIGSNKAGLGEFSDPIAWALYYNAAISEAGNNQNCRHIAAALAARSVTLTCN